MGSGLAWLDSSREDQQRICELIGLFSDKGTLDELTGTPGDATGTVELTMPIRQFAADAANKVVAYAGYKRRMLLSVMA